MKHPQYFSQVDKYNILISDFPTKFEKYIFTAIQGLFFSGAKAITAIDIENYLSSNITAKTLFEKQNGVEYLRDIEDFSNDTNFDYYYTKLKKLNLLKDLEKSGIDIKEFYDDNPLSMLAQETNSKFEELTIQDIINSTKRKILKLEANYAKAEEVKTENFADTFDDFITELTESYDIGIPVQGEIFNRIISGAMPGALTIRSAASGVGKAIPNSTLIPTPYGWRRVDEIKQGQYLFDAAGKKTKVLGIYPQGKRKVYQITFSDGRIANCDVEHIWSYYTTDNNKKILISKTLRDIIDTENLYDVMGNYRIYIPVNGAVQYPKRELYHSTEGLILSIKTFGYDSEIEEYCQETKENRKKLIEALLFEYGEIFEGAAYLKLPTPALNKPTVEILRSLGYITSLNKHNIINIYNYPQGGGAVAITKIEALDSYEEMTCFYVDNSKHLFLMNDYIVTHNTRRAISDACQLAYPIRYNSNQCKWVRHGSNEKVLFVVTEQSFKEVKRMCLAYLTDINEARFGKTALTAEEQERIRVAREIVKKYNNIIFMKIPDPSIELIKAMIREQCLTNDIKHVFYDYIFISPGLLTEFRGIGLRNDKVFVVYIAFPLISGVFN